MKLYEVKFTPGFRETVLAWRGGARNVGGKSYFGSRTQARRWCVSAIKSALLKWKREHGVTKLSEVCWGERLTISVCQTSEGVTTKNLFLGMLNH